MRVAKEQASIREKAADYVRDGKQVPDELVRKYNKALRSKLCTGRTSTGDASPSPERPMQQEVSTPRLESARKEPSSQTLSMVPPVQLAAQPSQAGLSVTATAPKSEMPQAPMMALITHRGISLNGLPSYAPPSMPSIITRSWSGTAMPHNMMQANPAVIVTSAGSAMSSSTAPAAIISAVPVVQGQASSKPAQMQGMTTVSYSSGGWQSARGTQVSWVPMLQMQTSSSATSHIQPQLHFQAQTQTQVWPLSPAPPSRPVMAPSRPTVKSL